MEMQRPNDRIDRNPTDPPMAPTKVEISWCRALSVIRGDMVSDSVDEMEGRDGVEGEVDKEKEKMRGSHPTSTSLYPKIQRHSNWRIPKCRL